MRGTFRDLKDLKFNRLTVLKCAGRKLIGNKYRYMWDCLCDCGTTIIVSSSNLVTNHTKSCGCLIEEYKQKRRDTPATSYSAKSSVFCKYRQEAKRRNLEFEISFEDAVKLFESNCHYCGIVPSRTAKHRKSKYVYNGIDRRDNNKGYTLNNVVACCSECNWAKHIRSENQFFEWIQRVSKHNNL